MSICFDAAEAVQQEEEEEEERTGWASVIDGGRVASQSQLDSAAAWQ
jgi:hypothetical protein